MPSSNCPLVIAVKLETEENVRTAAMLMLFTFYKELPNSRVFQWSITMHNLRAFY